MARNFEFAVGEYYHLYNRGTDKRDIFLHKGDYERFVGLLYLCNSEHPIHRSDYQSSTLTDIFRIKVPKRIVAVGAYCLMPNHFHILVKEIKPNGISSFMQKFSTAYTMFFNKKYERTGALFESRFRARHVDNDRYFTTVKVEP